MDYLEKPEIKSVYEKCKYIVKLWEHNFKKDKGRLPSKLDIREANQEVRHAYRKYFQLKTTALEQSFSDVDGFNFEPTTTTTEDNCTENNSNIDQTENDSNLNNTENNDKQNEQIWGEHLNKKIPEKPPEIKEKPSLNSTFSQKLFGGSKFTKRNPRRSRSFTQKKSETKKPFLSQPSSSSSNISFIDETVSNLSNFSSFDLELSQSNENLDVRIVNPTEKVVSQPTSIIQSVLNNNYKSLKSVDPGWLKRVVQTSGITVPSSPPATVQNNNEILSDEDIIYESDDEHVPKKPRFSLLENKSILNETLSSRSNFSNLFQSNPSTVNENNNDNAVGGSKEEKTNTVSFNPEHLFDTAQTSNLVNLNNKLVNEERVEKSNTNQQSRRSSRSTRNKANLNEFNSDIEEDPFHSDNDSDFTLEQINKQSLTEVLKKEKQKSPTKKPSLKKTSRKTSPRKKEKMKKNQIQETEASLTPEEPVEYELEFSIKPRVSVPRYKNLNKLIKTNKPITEEIKEEKIRININNRRQQEIDKFHKKIESGNLNENYVRIDLRKKIYSRGKKNWNFSKYKKKLWKSKKKALAGPDMDMGGCDGGILKCFNCGDAGHFAQNCKKAKGDNLLPLEVAKEEEEACPFPTLEEASQMAKDSVLAVRKPKVLSSEHKDDDDNDNEENIESSSDEELDEMGDDIFDEADTEKLLAETLKLEEHITKLDLQNYLDDEKVVEPYYKLQEDGSIIDTPEEVFNILSKFNHPSFRPGQEQAIMRILSGKSVLVTLSTGSGKSLCYQLPAYLYSQRQPCITLVISPLVSLMEDQITGIPNFLKAACLHTNQTKLQKEKIMDAIASGNLNILLVSPEAVVAGEKSSVFGSLLRKLPPIAFACIDEAHCVSQWSHNFRPSYLMICRVLRERMGVKTILGLTATATRATSDSIVEHLQISDGEKGIISDIPLPDNLILSISKDYGKDNALLSLLSSERFNNCRSIIIYCTRRDECERIASYLRTSLKFQTNLVTESKKRKRGIHVEAEPYHAGLSASKRKTIQKAFMSGELRIVVATVAFGMGINKSDIRGVIHYNMPKNFESYVQEIGRAGRDGIDAHCHLFLDAQGKDENELRRHIHANSIDRHIIRKLLQKVFTPCTCYGNCPRHEVAFSIEETVRTLDVPEENISTLLCYLELHKNKYIELLSPAYTICKIVSYGGPLLIRKAAKECAPLAMALALQKNEEQKDLNILEFPVIDIASTMGWDSGICKHKLKNLQWTTVNGQPKRTCLNVEFSNLGYRLLAPGNLSDDQLDEALDSLYEHVIKQEDTALKQLRAVHQTLIEFASNSFKEFTVNSDALKETSYGLKTKIRQYFNSPNPLETISLTETTIIDEDLLVADIRNLIQMYRDNNFNGRAIARIFHGIMSPNYPAVIWGRCKYWRKHINVNFHTICKIATKEILKMKC